MVTSQAGLTQNKEMQVLQETYLNNVLQEIAAHLEGALFWAMKDHQGLGYFLERGAVVAAAGEILNLLPELKTRGDKQAHQAAIKKLYTVLMQQQKHLDGLWIFSFGHKNTRHLIKETLAILDGLTVIGGKDNEFDANFIRECKESAIHTMMHSQLRVAIGRIEVGKQNLSSQEDWKNIKQLIYKVQTSCDSVYSFYEINYFIVQKMQKLRKVNSPLLEPFTQLRGEVRKIWDEYMQDHPELMIESKYFSLKTEKIKSVLDNAFDIRNVQLKPSHRGFNECIDFIIEGEPPSHALFSDFMQYQSQSAFMSQEYERLDSELMQVHTVAFTLERIQKDILPALIASDFAESKIELDLLPGDLKNFAEEIIRLRSYIAGKVPDDLTCFTDAIQESFKDRTTMDRLTVDKFDQDLINNLFDQNLKSDVLQLYSKIYKREDESVDKEQPGLFSKVWSFFTTSEAEEDWPYQLDKLKDRKKNQLRDHLQAEIARNYSTLQQKIEQHIQDTQGELTSLEEQHLFLQKKIRAENAKGGIYYKCFRDMAEFYEFEQQLKEIPRLQTAKYEKQSCLSQSKSSAVFYSLKSSLNADEKKASSDNAFRHSV